MGLFDFLNSKKNEPTPIKQVNTMIQEALKSDRLDRKAVKVIADFIREKQIDFPFPKELIDYMKKERETVKIEDVLEVYIRHNKNLKKDTAELNKAKKMGVKKVKIRTCQDARVCSVCKKHANKSYDIDKAPKLPLCWDCRCYYEPQI